MIQAFNDQSKLHSQAYELLLNAESFKALRTDSNIFLQKLVQHPSLLKDMLDICLRPFYFQSIHSIILTPDIPARAIDSLTTLYEDFIDLLAYDKMPPKQRPLQGLQEDIIEESSQMEPEEKNQQKVEQFIYLTHIHKCLLSEENQTAQSYLVKLLGPVYYHRPAEVMRFYEERPEVIKLIIGKLNTKTFMEIFSKMMEAQSGKQFFKTYKCRYIDNYYEQLLTSLDGQKTQQWLQCTLQFQKFITEKIEQKYDGTKYLGLLESMDIRNLQVIASLNQKIKNYKDQSSLLSLKLIQELLKHDTYVMGSATNKLSLSFSNRKNSISNYFYSEEKIEVKKPYHLNHKTISTIASLLLTANQKYISNEQKPIIKGQLLITLFRCLYFFVRIWINNVLDKKIQNSQEINVLLNQRFFQKTFRVIIEHPNNTILHNYIKELTIECLKQAIIKPSFFLNSHTTYMQLLLLSFPRTKDNHTVVFSSQIYHIFKQILSLNRHNPELQQIEPIIESHTQRLSSLIGGDPRKLNSDNLRGSNNAFSQSSQEVQFDLYSHGNFSNNLNKSLISSGLKFYNSSGVQRSCLQEVGEERIVIEGAENDDDDDE